ncbi:MAG: carbohydrate ABC transporter substrate-binding protein [Ruminococcus sp.]|nr:carbohydrate ABC transporter substrate-binding protein [Ruminococcus sp.]
MNNYKRAAAGLLAVISAFSAASCGSSGGSKNSSSSSYVDQVEVKESADITPIPEGAESTLEWCSYFDINPTRADPEKRTDLTLFEQNGGSIEYYRTSSLDKYDKLAARLLSNDPPDMFWYEMKMTFPANCIKDMFQPVDPIVDFDSAMWSDVKDVAENFTLKGEHYVAPINFLPNSVITYDADVIEANGLDDPYELYQEGKWDWDAWYDLMEEYVQGAEGDEERYGINGWFAPFIFQSTGKTLIKYDADKDEYVSNLDDPDFVRATDLLYDIQKNGYYYADWVGQTGDAFKKNILFYAMGPWASSGSHCPKDGESWVMVPIPKDPNSDTLYTTVDMNAYMWVKGSTKNDAMKCWLECAKIVYTQDEYIQTERDKFFVNNPTWTDQMYDIAYVEPLTEKFTRLFDPGYGISTTLSDDDAATNDTKEAVIPYMYTSVMKTDDNGTQFTWAQLKEQYKPTIESELKTFNEAYKAFVSK